MKATMLLVVMMICLNGISQNNTEQVILRLSKEKNTYMNPDKLDKLKPFLDDRMVFIHSNGLTETKEGMFKNIREGVWQLRSVELRETEVRVFKNNFAVLIGKGTFNAINAGKNTSTELYFTEIWTHVKKGWLLASRHANKIL